MVHQVREGGREAWHDGSFMGAPLPHHVTLAGKG